MNHVITLQYPDKYNIVNATCSCGYWTMMYGWGEVESAKRAAGDHIEKKTLSQPLERRTLGGPTQIIPGESL